MQYNRTTLVKAIFRDSTALDLEYHGPEHWKRVARVGRYIAAIEGVEPVFCEIFGLVHDCQRTNDGADKRHGRRAASYARHIQHLLPLDKADFRKLCYALRMHDDGFVAADPQIGACWDADRLDLPRVGIMPHPSGMSTEMGRRIARRMRHE